MELISTVSLFIGTILIAYICGMSLMLLLVDKEDSDSKKYLAIPLGYLIYSWVAYIISGNFGFTGTKTTYIALGIFFILFLYSNYRHYRINNALYNHLSAFKSIFITSSVIIIVILWPLFYIGSETFLGAVNPDYFAGLFDNEFLLTHSSLQQSLESYEYSYVNSMIGHMPPSARFSSGFFAILLDVILPVNAQEALTLSIGLFLFSVPLSSYVLARTIFKFEHKVSLLSAYLMGISTPIALSFMYFYVGQNSGLGAMPAAMVAIYLYLKHQNLKSFLLATFVINSFFVMYMGMLAYIIAPLGILVMYMLYTKEISIKTFIITLIAFFSLSVILNFNMVIFLYNSLTGWANIVGQTLQGQYFLDFLTEEFFPLFFGLASYNIQASFYYYLKNHYLVSIILFTNTLIVASYLIYFIFKFIREHKYKNSIVFGISAILVYGVVWYIYTFDRNYGYAVFKMASWIQFILIIFIAYGINKLYQSYSDEKRPGIKKIKRFTVILFVFIYVGSNLVSTTRLTTYTLGNNNVTGNIINLFNVSGNKDYKILETTLKNYVKKDETIGLININSIQNELVGFYLRNYKTSIMSHLQLPGDDENLPDIKTSQVVDYYGNITISSNPFLHDKNDFYLINKSNKNQDVTNNFINAKPIYENSTFALYKNKDIKDFIFTGKGWYRLEHSTQNDSYWWPKNYRWSSEGGEIYLLNTDKEKDYSLSFFVYAGYGKETPVRTFEIWVNKEKVEEIIVDKSALVKTKKFKASQNLNTIVIVPKERVTPLKRKLPLFNKDIPYDYRGLNFLIADVEITSNNKKVINGLEIFKEAEEFNGLEPNAWVSNNFKVKFKLKNSINRIGLDIMVPGVKEISLPLKLNFLVNGIEKEIEINEYGNNHILFDLNKDSKIVTLVLDTDISFSPAHSSIERKVNYTFNIQRLIFDRK